ncbi:MAG TPA: ATP-binding protein [Gemmatimonadaceae bacterium]
MIETSANSPSATDVDSPSDLFGNGAMAALMRQVDWAATPLGPVESWPQSLKTTVSTCLSSRFPMFVWWGRELTMIYNEGYAPMLGAKHPALGRPASVVWAEIWDIVGPMADGVMTRAEATWSDDQMLPLHRYGFTEETYFTFTYSPIRDESGGVGGVFCAVIETTERVIGARRLAALRELGSRSVVESADAAVACRAAAAVLEGYAADAPFALLYLLDDKGTTARLAGASGLPGGHAASPATLDAAAPSSNWPLAEVSRERRPIEVADITESFGALHAAPWPEPIERALVLPIARAGQEQPWGFLVAGISPRLALDEGYRGFLELVAGQVAVAVENGHAYEQEKRRAAALAELDRAKTAFFSNVSHEFRTPLALLLGPAEELLADPTLPPEHRADVELVHRNALRLLTLVNALLDFSRIEAGRIDARYERTDLATFTADLASTFRSAIEKAGLRLDVDCPPLPAGTETFVDRAMWERIVLNLLSNALKHTFEGGITVSVRADASNATLVVADTGIGIPPDQLPNLFKRFHRVPNARARTHEGSGIGLAFVQELVRLHGGSVSVSSTEGRGTTFTVTIPTGAAHLPAEHLGQSAALDERTRTRIVQQAERWSQPVSPTTSAAVGESQGTVFLVDDNADMREYASRLLTDAKWRVATFADGLAALDAARAEPPDVIVSDVMMPGRDGFALLRELRGDPRTAAIPIILLSARAGEEARVEGLSAGADDYLVKPFTARDLTARVSAHVTLARARAGAKRELEAVGERLTTIFRQAPVAIAVLRGPDHVFELTNEPYRELIGGRDVIGKPIAEALPELAGQNVFELLDEVFRTGVPYVGRELRTMLQRGPGEPRETFFNFVYQPMIDASGAPDSIVVVATDVTQFVRSRHAAEEANRVKSDFLAAMSHELRTPLNAIGGYVDILELGVHGALNEAQLQSLERVRVSQHRLLALINDVLNFAKIEAGRVVYKVQPVKVDDAVRAVSPLMEPQLSAKGVRYETSVPDGLMALADDDKLQQILINLLSNAVKFTDRGGLVRVEAAESDGRIEVRVRDTGVGIAADKHEAIFDPFVQVNRRLTSNSEGTGLGLAISRDLARGMGAELRVESVPGEGATFILALRKPENSPG